jgi:copper chaperone
MSNLIGVKSYDVDLKNQSAEVITADDALDFKTVLSTIQKTGKKVKSGKADGEDMSVEAIAS